MNWNIRIFIVSLIVIMLFFTPIVLAPPTPHTINGYIFVVNMSNPPTNLSQTALGTKYSINDSASGYYKQSQTALAALPGYYSESISGTNGDNVTILAWNNLNFGETNISLLGTMRGINVTLNLTRESEPTVNITYPQDNTLRNDSIFFTIISNISFFGQTSSNCVVKINYSNTSVLSSYNNQDMSVPIGSPSAGYSQLINWNISGNNVGTSNITVNFTCDNMPVRRFETLTNFDTLINITIQDKKAPNITLISPANNTLTRNPSILFTYNVTDTNNVINCSLYINGTYNQSNASIQKGELSYFNASIIYGVSIWQVTCKDEYNNTGYSQNFTIIKSDFNPPTITTVLVDDQFVAPFLDQIDLYAAQTVPVFCNFSVNDTDGVIDIVSANATFYVSGSTPISPDDNSTHYTNSSCIETWNNGIDTKNFTCGFNVYYYANNGTWQCNASAIDTQNAIGIGNDSTVINPLYALNATASIDFGDVPTGSISPEKNITVINLGNIRLNINLSAYAITQNDGIAMNCTNANISLNDLRYSKTSGVAFSAMNFMPYSDLAFNLAKQQTPVLSQNYTYWRVNATPPSFGDCRGVIVITADQK